MALAGREQDYDVAARCANQTGLQWTKIQSCATGKLGHELSLKNYNVTASLEPPHKYTPWITINGKVGRALPYLISKS